jgi:hypothetical protein
MTNASEKSMYIVLSMEIEPHLYDTMNLERVHFFEREQAEDYFNQKFQETKELYDFRFSPLAETMKIGKSSLNPKLEAYLLRIPLS